MENKIKKLDLEIKNKKEEICKILREEIAKIINKLDIGSKKIHFNIYFKSGYTEYGISYAFKENDEIMVHSWLESNYDQGTFGDAPLDRYKSREKLEAILSALKEHKYRID